MFKFIKRIFRKKTNLQEKISNSLFEGELKKSFKNKIDQEFIKNLEASLLKADIGVEFSQKLISKLENIEKNSSYEQIKDFIKEEIKRDLKNYVGKLEISKKPYVILTSGVNGSGKTTSLGKLAHKLSKDNKKVILAACDTFRAAAAAQLDIWAKRSDVKILTSEKEAGDPAALAYKAVKMAQDEDYDVVLIDTAGRLQNNKNFMEQLAKINRVIKKLDDSSPHLSLLVIDGTTGQNALRQLEIFKDYSEVNGLIVTKLDGTAKGGAIIPMVSKFNIPVYFLGMGEGIEDLQEFDIDKFIRNIL